MGLSNFHIPAEGVLPVLVMNTVLSVALLKNMVKSVLQMVGPTGICQNLEEDPSISDQYSEINARGRRVSITRFELLWQNRSGIGPTSSGSGNSNKWCPMECCVCLCGFKGEEEVSELGCKHFFHKGCLEKWFDNQHRTCPLCRSLL